MGDFVPHQYVTVGTGVEIGDHHRDMPPIHLAQDDIVGLCA